MPKYTTYYGPEMMHLDKARLCLALFSRDMVEDIIKLIGYRGNAVVADIFDSEGTEYDPPHVLGVLSRDYIKSYDAPAIILSLATILMAQVKSGGVGRSQYADILGKAFSIPAATAAAIAANIETHDIISWDSDHNGNIDWTGVSAKLIQGVKNIVNYVPHLIGMSWEWGQDQKFDTDFLYELHRLGEAIVDLNTRARLMNAQAAIAIGMRMFQATGLKGGGDPAGDVLTDAEVGDLVAKAAAPNLPPTITGKLQHAVTMGKHIHAGATAKSLNDAGLSLKDGKVIRSKTARHPKKRKAWDSILSMKPSTGALAGGALGIGLLAALVLPALLKGDPADNDELYGDIAEQFGDAIADAWLQGDIDTLAAHVLETTFANPTLGDPAADDRVEAMVGDALTSEGIDAGTELGGLFSRWRMNRAKRKMLRKRKRALRKAKRRNRRAREKQLAGLYDQEADQEKSGAYETDFTRVSDEDLDPELAQIRQFRREGGAHAGGYSEDELQSNAGEGSLEPGQDDVPNFLEANPE